MGRCLVTGGAGFLGAHLVRALLDGGDDIIVLDDLSGGFRENVDDRARFIQGSIIDQTGVDRVFEAGRFDVVYHLAAYAAEGLSHFTKRFNYVNNVVGSMNLINAAVKHETRFFVFTSSAAVYGTGQLPLAETVRPLPEDSYGIAKHAVEQELAITSRMFDLPYTIFRPHNIFGEFQNIGDRYRNVVGIFMNQILNGKPLSIFGDGGQTRAFTYVSDIIPAFVDAPTNEAARNEVFNIGADEACTVNRLACLIRSAMGVPDHPIMHCPARYEVRDVVADHTKARAIFGDLPHTPLETGIERMAAWARTRGPTQPQKFSTIEIEKNLPAVWL